MTHVPIHWYLFGALMLYALMAGMSDGLWHWSTLKANVHGDFTSLHSPLRDGDRAGTFEIVKDTASCQVMGRDGATRCDYRAGRSLHISIAGVGEDTVDITFMRSNADGAFYASFVPRYGCVLVERNRTVSRGPKYRNPFLDRAFISPVTGAVYPEWKACMSATKSRAS